GSTRSGETKGRWRNTSALQVRHESIGKVPMLLLNLELLYRRLEKSSLRQACRHELAPWKESTSQEREHRRDYSRIASNGQAQGSPLLVSQSMKPHQGDSYLDT